MKFSKNVSWFSWYDMLEADRRMTPKHFCASLGFQASTKHVNSVSLHSRKTLEHSKLVTFTQKIVTVKFSTESELQGLKFTKIALKL